jgi:hypothetical protein
MVGLLFTTVKTGLGFTTTVVVCVAALLHELAATAKV